MQLAGARLNNRVAKVKRQVTAAKALRSEVTDQLSAVQRLLTEALGMVKVPTPAEQAELVEQAEPTVPIRQAEPIRPTEPTKPIRQAEPADQAELTTQTGPAASRSSRADDPTARFGLHP
jgi:hypothetical protein